MNSDFWVHLHPKRECSFASASMRGVFFFDCHDDLGFGRRRTYVNKHAAKASAADGNPGAPCVPKHSYA
jgi:hypothetical protein